MVMGIVWAGLLLLSLAAGLWNGSAPELAGAAMEGAASAITLGLSLAGALCLWSGLTKVMEVSGITKGLSKLMRPIFRRLFPAASRDDKALGYLSANVTANLLGLGNAATPMGIAAVKRMKELSGGTQATDEMCRLIVMNTASIQLLPTTVAAVRTSLGARSAFDILPAVWLTSIGSVTAGILAAKLLSKVKRHG